MQPADIPFFLSEFFDFLDSPYGVHGLSMPDMAIICSLLWQDWLSSH